MTNSKLSNGKRALNVMASIDVRMNADVRLTAARDSTVFWTGPMYDDRRGDAHRTDTMRNCMRTVVLALCAPFREPMVVIDPGSRAPHGAKAVLETNGRSGL
jgi:hypothetical protein